MKFQQSGTLRLAAFALDWLAILIWMGLLFGVVLILWGGNPPEVTDPWTAQAIGFLALTLPVILYFSITESSKWEASLGKRIVGLRVSTIPGERLSFLRAILRNGIKFAPWEIAHLAIHQMFSEQHGEFASWVYPALILSWALPLWWIVSLLLKDRAPYDRWTGTRVERRVT